MKGKLIISALIVLWMSSCTISFKGTSISPEVESFYVERFDNQVFNAPPTVGMIFSEQFRDKMLQETRLSYTDTDPHISFSGKVVAYEVTSEAPQDDLGAEFNRLEITVMVDYENAIDEESWSQRFSFFSEFAQEVNLNDVEEELIEEIYDQILEDVFNKAFADW